jgi:hypothetical protein
MLFDYCRKVTTSIPRQADLNVLQVGPVFDATANQAQVLANIFFAMTYAAGLPISMPLAMVACIFYFYMDKLLLLRYFQKPPVLGNSVMMKVLDVLYYAALFRLAIACWMFGLLPVNWQGFVLKTGTDDDYSYVTASTTSLDPSSTSYTGILMSIRESVVENGNSMDLITFFTDRLFVPNVFPIFLLFCVIVLSFLLSALFKFIYRVVPIFWVLDCLLKFCSKKNSKIYDSSTTKMAAQGQNVDGYDIAMIQHELRKHSAPLTGPYFKYVPANQRRGIFNCCNNRVAPDPRDSIKDTEREEGWDVIEEQDVARLRGITEETLASYNLHYFKSRNRYIQVKHWMKMAPTLWDSYVNEQIDRASVGELKRTFELIREHACSTYALDEIPAYATATVGIIESLQALKEEDDKNYYN